MRKRLEEGKQHAQRLKRKGSVIAKVDGDASKAASKTSIPSFNLPWPRSATAKLLTAWKRKKKEKGFISHTVRSRAPTDE